MNEESSLIVFEDSQIRRTWHNDEWWFVILDVVEVVAESSNPSRYIKDMRRRDKDLGVIWGDITLLLTVETTGGKQRANCSNMEGIFRIIQSISSPKAEPFKRWLARLGRERIQEIENPELAAERARQYYQDLGYSEDWIKKRLQSIEIRGQLTDEWKGRGVEQGLEYAILTSEISKATFGMSPSDYKKYKGLKRENLRDHMSNLELIFTMLGEESTRQQAIKDDAQGFFENKQSAQKGGDAAGKALDTYEEQSETKVVSDKNYLAQIKEAKDKLKKKLKGGKDKKG